MRWGLVGGPALALKLLVPRSKGTVYDCFPIGSDMHNSGNNTQLSAVGQLYMLRAATEKASASHLGSEFLAGEWRPDPPVFRS
jgi:hypothetical protein